MTIDDYATAHFSHHNLQQNTCHVLLVHSRLMSISCYVCLHTSLPRSTQPGHPSVGSRNEYPPNGSDTLCL